jgi:ElaB/YqjD/DUF883 family membrane-anchored ribosome-binding protein
MNRLEPTVVEGVVAQQILPEEHRMAQGTHQARDTGSAADIGSGLKDSTVEQIDKLAGQVEGAAKSVRDQGREMGEQVQVVADNFKTALDKSVRDQPIMTLALTAAVAFVIGALWKS